MYLQHSPCPFMYIIYIGYTPLLPLMLLTCSAYLHLSEIFLIRMLTSSLPRRSHISFSSFLLVFSHSYAAIAAAMRTTWIVYRFSRRCLRRSNVNGTCMCSKRIARIQIPRCGLRHNRMQTILAQSPIIWIIMLLKTKYALNLQSSRMECGTVYSRLFI